MTFQKQVLCKERVIRYCFEENVADESSLNFSEKPCNNLINHNILKFYSHTKQPRLFGEK